MYTFRLYINLSTDSRLLLSRPHIEPSEHRNKIIEELPTGSLPAVDSDNIQIDTVNFSSHPPSFGNEKLLNAYELKQPKHSETIKVRQKVDTSSHGNADAHSNDSRRKERISGLSSAKSRESTEASNTVSVRENKRVVNQSHSSSHTDLQADRTRSTESRLQETSATYSTQKQNGQTMPEAAHLDRVKGQASYSTTSTLDSGVALRFSTGSVSPAEVDSLSPSPRYGSTSAGLWPADLAPDSGRVGDGWDESLNSDPGLGGSQHSTDSGFASVERQVKTQVSVH